MVSWVWYRIRREVPVDQGTAISKCGADSGTSGAMPLPRSFPVPMPPDLLYRAAQRRLRRISGFTLTLCPYRASRRNAPLCAIRFLPFELDTIMITGTVKFFNADKGYGFIAPEGGGDDAFVHISAVERAGMHTLDKDQRVSYELEKDQRGKMSAVNLQSA
jgi:CspA family cold shock protein